MKIESRKTIELVQFVDAGEIDPIYFEKPFYVVPDGELAEDGLRRRPRGAAAHAEGRARPDGAARRRIDRGGEALRPRARCWRRCAFRTRSARPDALFAGIEDEAPAEELIAMADELIEPPHGAVRREPLQGPLQRRALQGADRPQAGDGQDHRRRRRRGHEQGGGAKIIDLMAALKASVAAASRRHRPGHRRRRKQGRCRPRGLRRSPPIAPSATSRAPPSPEARPSATAGDCFVVQKHAARRLHYDFRLELDGVLKSWAVTRGPSYDPADKRLAVRTEDHPLDYGTFEGTIPDGEYGGGTVMLWDQGTWRPLHDPQDGLAEGHLHFLLDGTRLKGEWSLVRMRPDRTGGKRENWLLIKGSDGFAEAEGAEPAGGRRAQRRDRPHAWPRSPAGKTGDGQVRAASRSPPAPARQAAPAARPSSSRSWRRWSRPPPEGPDWLHELKYDGYRAQMADRRRRGAGLHPQRARLDRPLPRAGHRRPDAGPRQCADRRRDRGRRRGRPHRFRRLQAACSDGDGRRCRFVAFDLLRLDGRDLRRLPLRRAQAAAAPGRWASAAARDRCSTAIIVEGDGPAFLAEVSRARPRGHRRQARGRPLPAPAAAATG